MKKTFKLMAMLMCIVAVGATVSCKNDDKENESMGEAYAYAAAAAGIYDGYLDIAYTFEGEEFNEHYDGHDISVTNPVAQKISITVPDVNGMTVTVNGWFDNKGTITPENILIAEQSFGATFNNSTLSYNKETQVLSGQVTMLMRDINEDVTATAVATIYGQKR